MSLDGVIIEKAHRLIWQNRSRQGGTKLLERAREIEGSDKIQAMEVSPNGHSKALIHGSAGELYEVWLYNTSKVFCSCAFFADVEPYQRQALGCKHVLAHALRLVQEPIAK